jgi:hypothetical protein
MNAIEYINLNDPETDVHVSLDARTKGSDFGLQGHQSHGFQEQVIVNLERNNHAGFIVRHGCPAGTFRFPNFNLFRLQRFHLVLSNR